MEDWEFFIEEEDALLETVTNREVTGDYRSTEYPVTIGSETEKLSIPLHVSGGVVRNSLTGERITYDEALDISRGE